MRMRSRDDRPRPRRPSFEGLEPRDLPSVVPLLMHGASFGQAAPTGSVLQALLAAQGQPTPHEAARQRFVAKFSGPYVVGPPRSTDQAAQVFVLGSGGSNQSFHMNLQMGLFTPADTAQGRVSGIAALFPKNVATTGSLLALDAIGSPAELSHGLPTHLTWTVDPNSGGIYLAAGPFGTGSGTIDIHYAPGGKVPGRGRSAGTAFVVVQGTIDTGGVFNNLGTLGNRSQEP